MNNNLVLHGVRISDSSASSVVGRQPTTVRKAKVEVTGSCVIFGNDIKVVRLDTFELLATLSASLPQHWKLELAPASRLLLVFGTPGYVWPTDARVDAGTDVEQTTDVLFNSVQAISASHPFNIWGARDVTRDTCDFSGFSTYGTTTRAPLANGINGAVAITKTYADRFVAFDASTFRSAVPSSAGNGLLLFIRYVPQFANMAALAPPTYGVDVPAFLFIQGPLIGSPEVHQFLIGDLASQPCGDVGYAARIMLGSEFLDVFDLASGDVFVGLTSPMDEEDIDEAGVYCSIGIRMSDVPAAQDCELPLGYRYALVPGSGQFGLQGHNPNINKEI